MSAFDSFCTHEPIDSRGIAKDSHGHLAVTVAASP